MGLISAAARTHSAARKFRDSLSMPSNNSRPAERIILTFPVIFLVLAATAIPIEFRALGEAKFEFRVDIVRDIAGNIIGYVPIGVVFRDILANIIGYVPVGIVLGELGLLRAVLISGSISAFAESSQLVMMYRDPSFVDVVSNVAGATLGALVSARWKIRSPALRISIWRAVFAVLLAFALVFRVVTVPGVNARGNSRPECSRHIGDLTKAAAVWSWILPATG
jgi:glycopeptide antibiotics resistance protein